MILCKLIHHLHSLCSRAVTMDTGHIHQISKKDDINSLARGIQQVTDVIQLPSGYTGASLVLLGQQEIPSLAVLGRCRVWLSEEPWLPVLGVLSSPLHFSSAKLIDCWLSTEGGALVARRFLQIGDIHSA